MRALLLRPVVTGVVLAVAAGSWIPTPSAHSGPDTTIRLDLSAPTGPLQVGTTSLHLVDDSRIDPLAPTSRVRELMVRLWYPGRREPAAGREVPDTGCRQPVHRLPACGNRRRPAL